MTPSDQQNPNAQGPFDIEKLRSALAAYQPEPRNPKKEAFLALYPTIRQRMEAGLTVKQLRQVLERNDLSISHATLVRYLKEARAGFKEPSRMNQTFARANSAA